MLTSPNKTSKVEFETNPSSKLDHLPKCSFCSRRDDSVYVVSIFIHHRKAQIPG